MATFTKTVVTPVVIRAYCECGGELTATGEILCSNPPQLPHRCGVCGHMESFSDAKYPSFGYEIPEIRQSETHFAGADVRDAGPTPYSGRTTRRDEG